MRLRHRFWILTIFTLLSAHAHASPVPARPGDDAEWWNPQWRYRYPVRVAASRSTPRPTVAWTRFFIPAQGRHPKGADIRVIDAQGNTPKMKLMYFEPALYAIVAFEIRPGDSNYWIYLGNPKPGKPPAKWEPKAGVFLETRRLERVRKANNWKDFTQTLAATKISCGASFRSRVYDGYNPFGKPDLFASIYTAWLNIPASRSYTFCTVSADASFLRIDGKEVCKWPGRHNAGGRIKKSRTGTVRLSKGLHRLEYYHVDFGGPQTAVAGWLPSSAKEFQIISSRHFAPILPASALPLQERNAPLTADFQYGQTDWIYAAGHFYTLYAFADVSARPTDAEITKRAWTFEDGSTVENGSTVEGRDVTMRCVEVAN